MRILLVGGIYGVGKTSLCQKLAPALSARHLTASELIRHGSTLEDRYEKTVDDLDANQRLLIIAVDEFKGSAETILLDGHFCLLAPGPRVAPIPIEVFAAIDPAAILLVEAPAALVKTRLERRDGRTYDMELLNHLANQERAQAKLVSASLSVPFLSISYDDPIEDARLFLESSVRSPQ